MEKPKRGIGAIETGMALIDALARATGPMPLKAVAEAAGMPAAKAHRYLASFIATGMVVQPGGSHHYDLGPMALRVGVAALNRFDVLDRAGAGLAGLRDTLQATCLITGWTDRGPIILRAEDSLRPLTVIAHVGETMPVTTSAPGRAWLAFPPAEQTADLVERELADRHAPTDIDAERLKTLISEARASGLARTDGDFHEGVASLAAPLYDPLGLMVGTVSALGRAEEYDWAYDGAVAQALRDYTAGLAKEG